MTAPCRIVLCTCPDAGTAQAISTALVERELAACVNILPSVTSVYRWEGRVEQDQELLLVIKTTEGRYPEVEGEIRARHPYEVPEIIAVPIIDGLPEYLQWVGGNAGGQV